MPRTRSVARIVGFLSLATFGMACAPGGPGGIEYASGKGSVTVDGLHQVKWEPFRTTYVKPGADLQVYDKVVVDPFHVSYKTPPHPRNRMRESMDSNYALSPSAIASIEQHAHDAFVKALGESENFTVVQEPGPDVLRIRGQIVNLQITVPTRQDMDPDETVYAQSAGQMTLILEARDSVSGEPLVRVGEAQAIESAGGAWFESNPAANGSAVRGILNDWARKLRRELDQFHALPALPPVTSTDPAL